MQHISGRFLLPLLVLSGDVHVLHPKLATATAVTEDAGAGV